MKTSRAPVALALFVPFMSSFQGQPMIPLEEKIKQELRLLYFDTDHPSLEKRLLALGDARTITPILLELAAKHKTAQPSELEYRYLISSVTALGKLRERQALPILQEAATSGGTGIRLAALRAIGEIDPAGSRDLLLKALNDEDPSIRYTAADSLSKLDDPVVLMELDVKASRERSHAGFLRLQSIADATRTRIREKLK